MNGFVKSLYNWNYTGLVQDNYDDDDMMMKRVTRMLTLLYTLKTMTKKNDNANDDGIVLD